MSGPGIAVVVTCYQLGRTITQAVESARTQDLPPDELLVVDDGSTDLFTRHALARLEDQNIRIVRTPNRGVSAARNLGISLTSAPYVVLLDGDDLLAPSYLRKASAVLDADPTLSFVSCGMQYFGGADHVWYPDPPNLIGSLTRGVVHVSSMFRRGLWEAIGGFDESMRAHEELDFWTTAVERGYRGDVIQETLLHYRSRPGSLYRTALLPENHSALMARFYRKHEPALVEHVEELLLEKERFILDQRSHQEFLVDYERRLADEAASLERDIQLAESALRQLGMPVVDFGELSRTTPFSRSWGLERGTPVDRHYLHEFLNVHRGDIHGRVLEVQNSHYARLFGEGVTAVDVVDIDAANPEATIVADLTRADAIPSDTYDCVILTQVLPLIFDVRAAVAEVHRVLKPGGVVLCSVPAVTAIITGAEAGPDRDHWRFTEIALLRMFSETFSLNRIAVTAYGNTLTCSAFLSGLSIETIDHVDRDAHDPLTPLLYCARAEKSIQASTETQTTDWEDPSSAETVLGAILMYHRVTDGHTDHPLCVSSERLREQLTSLMADGWTIVPLRDLVRGQGRGGLRARRVALTFDDGYEDALRLGAPLLRELGLPATFFVVGSALDTGAEFWWDTLDRVFSDPTIPDTLQLNALRDVPPLATGTTDGRALARRTLEERCYRLPQVARDQLMRELREWSGIGPPSPDSPRPLSPAELVQLAAVPGVSIGAHGEHHVWLPHQTADALRDELVLPKRRLESLLKVPVTSFSYPYGAWDSGTAEAARSSGFLEAVTTEERAVRAIDEPVRLPRIDPAGMSGPDLVNHLRQAINGREAPGRPARALVAGWFSIPGGHATAGDLLARDIVCEWLSDAGLAHDVAVIPPFMGGVDWRAVRPADYSHVVFVCGPFARWREAALLERFAGCRLVGINLSMSLPVSEWNPFDVLFERDSSNTVRPDVVFLSDRSTVPVIGVCRVERYDGANVDEADAAIERLLRTREAAVVRIDTRLDVNGTGFRTAREIDAAIQRVDLLITTRLHGMVLALRHGVPVVAIDPEPGGGKISRQAACIGWPWVFDIGQLTDDALRQAVEACSRPEWKSAARETSVRAVAGLDTLRAEFVAALTGRP